MSASAPVDNASLPLSLAQRVDAVCVRFEAAWKSAAAMGSGPCLEEYLAETPEPERSALVLELIRLEVHYRRQLREVPQAADYQTRFPGLDSAWLTRVFELATNPSSSQGATQDTLLPSPAGLTPGSATERPNVAGYEILGVLGRGGMGVVYRARQLALKRLVALKMILAGSHAGPDERARFRTEAEAVAHLQHPHIVQIHEVGEQDGRPFLSLELVDGGSLAQKLSGTPLPPRDAARLVETLARAMHYAHQQGVIHRDLKPTNVLFTAAGVPKIMDFGLAKQVGEDARQTRSGAVVGTPSYMAPEQAASQAREIGPATDVYALGALLYEAVTGRPPFKAATVLETLEQVRSAEPLPPGRLQPNLAPDLETICLKCLEKEAPKRYASAADLAEDLRRFQAGETIRARPVGALERVVKWVKRRPAVAALLGVSGLAALALVAVLVGLLFNRRLQVAFEDANLARQAEEEQKEKAETNLYFHRILLAEHEWTANNVGRTLQLLDECPAHDRGWEWHFLNRLCHTDLRTLRGHESFITAVAVSPDGKTIASGGWDKKVIIWDATTAQVIRTLKKHKQSIWGLAFSHDGKHLASCSGEYGDPAGEVMVWATATWKRLFKIRGHTGEFSSVAFSPDDSQIASACGGLDKENEVAVWDAATGKHLLSFKDPGQPILKVAFSPDGTKLAWAKGSQDNLAVDRKPGAVNIVDIQTGKIMHTFHGHAGPVTCVAFSPKGQRIAFGSWDNTVKVLDVNSPQEILTLEGHANMVNHVAFSPDGARIGSASDDSSVKIWDSGTGRLLFTLRGHSGAVQSLAFIGPAGDRLVSVSNDTTLKIWDLSRQEPLRPGGHGTSVRALAFSCDGTSIVSGDTDGLVKIWDVANPKTMRTWRGKPDPVWGLAFSRDGTMLAAACGNWAGNPAGDVVKLWNTKTNQETATFPTESKIAWCVAFSPDGKYLAAGCDEFKARGKVRIWEVKTARELDPLLGHTGGVVGLAFNPDGKRLASCSDDKTLKIWNIGLAKAVVDIPHPEAVLCLAYSPDGRLLASGGDDGNVRIFDAADGRELFDAPLRGHTHSVHSVAFSPNGERLASCGTDQTIRIWHVPSGQELLTLRGRGGLVWKVAFSPDGQRLASAHDDGSVIFWEGGLLAQ